MSNNNTFWGKKFGTYSEHVPKNCKLPWGNHFPKTGYGSPYSNSGKTINQPETVQSKRDKEAYQVRLATIGRPVVYS